MSYFIYSVVKVMESKWSFVKKLDRGRASFSRYWHLKFTPEKPNSYITISVSKLQEPCCSSYSGRMLRIVTQSCFRKNSFYVKLTAFFTAENVTFDTKITNSESSLKNEHEVTLDSFQNFACGSCYLHSKSFAWKRDYLISQKLQTSQTSPRPF